MNIKSAFSGFSVNDLAKAKDFYSGTLGMEIVSEEMGLSFKMPDGGFVFAYEKPDHQPASFTILNFVVDDIDAAHDELASKGVKFEIYDDMPFQQDEKGIARAEKPEDGPTIAWFKDPAGNALALIQN